MGMVVILVKYHIYIYWILHMKFEFIQPSDWGGGGGGGVIAKEDI